MHVNIQLYQRWQPKHKGPSGSSNRAYIPVSQQPLAAGLK